MYIPRFETDSLSYHVQDLDSTTWTLNAVTDPQGGPLWGYQRIVVDDYGEYQSNSGLVDRTGVNNYAVTEKNNGLALMTKHLPKMLSECVPARRYFDLAYQLGELKDIPKTILGTIAIWVELERFLGKKVFLNLLSSKSFWTVEMRKRVSNYTRRLNINTAPDALASDAYLNFKFGWESTISAVRQLASRPQLAAKDINNLLKRNGKPATLRRTMKFREEVTSYPAITLYKPSRLTADANIPVSRIAYRDVELRCVVNTGINYPSADLPKLRKTLFESKLGFDLTPTALYDLVPWTWLIDWFTGASDYVALCDTISRDSSLINYGFMTYVSRTTVKASWTNYCVDVGSFQLNPGGGTDYSHKVTYGRHAMFTSKYQLRVDLSNLAGVKNYSGKGLTPYQGSILGALFSQYVKHK